MTDTGGGTMTLCADMLPEGPCKQCNRTLEPSHTDELVKAAGEAATQLESAAFEFELEALPDATRCRLIANTLRQALAKSPNPPEVKPLTDDDYCDHDAPLNDSDCCPICDAEFPPTTLEEE